MGKRTTQNPFRSEIFIVDNERKEELLWEIRACARGRREERARSKAEREKGRIQTVIGWSSQFIKVKKNFLSDYSLNFTLGLKNWIVGDTEEGDSKYIRKSSRNRLIFFRIEVSTSSNKILKPSSFRWSIYPYFSCF